MKRSTGGILLACVAIAGIVIAGIGTAQEPQPNREQPRGRFRGDLPRDEPAPERASPFRTRGAPPESRPIPAAGKAVSFSITIVEMNKEGKPKSTLDPSNADKIAEQIRALEEKGEASVISRVQLSSLEQMPCSVQIGESKPTVTGRAGPQFQGRDAARGPIQVSYQYTNVGMMIKLTSRVESDDAVLAEMELSSSRLVPSPKAGEDAPIPPERTTTMSTHSTVRIPKGRAVVVSASQSADTDESREMLVLITAKVESSPAAAATSADAKTAEEKAAAAAEKTLKVFKLQFASAAETATIVEKIADFPVDAAADIRTNSLIIRTPSTKGAELESLIERLDRAE